MNWELGTRLSWSWYNMNFQIRSMFDVEPTSAEVFFEPHPVEAQGTRTPNDTHPQSRRTVPQESGDNSCEHGGMPKPKSKKNEEIESPHPHKNTRPCSAQAPPWYTHKDTATTSATDIRVVSQNLHKPKIPERPTCTL